MRRSLPFIVLAAVAALAAWWLWPRAPGAGPKPARGGFAQPVVTAAAIEEDVTPVLSAVGTLRANDDVILRPEVAGRVAAIRFEEGQAVRRGQPLVRLDASLWQAEADKAHAAAELARRNFARVRELQEQSLASGRDRDNAQAELDASAAELAVTEARLQKATIAAPFDGVAGLRKVSVGDYVAPGQDLVRIVDLDPLKVDFELPETALPAIGTARNVEVSVTAVPGLRLSGEVYAVEPAVTDAGRNLLLRARLANPDGRLKPGLFARVQLQTGVRIRGITVPEAAIVPSSAGTVVFRAAGDHAESVPVTLGERRNGRVQVLAGVAAGDAIVVAGQEKLHDGAPIQPKPAR
jgi:membrane fusion protein, multidrug efflux system